MPLDHVDVLIVGAGLSGIGAACHLRERSPGSTFAILESRDAIGGTWDLFRYPGIRSDSDMFTLGYSFRPWTDSTAIADGPSIRSYVRDTAAEYGIEEHIRFGHEVVSAEWSSERAQWTVEARRTDTGETVHLTCGFLFTCSGYYRYDEGYTPELPGAADFAGPIVHPQHWPEDLDYAGKRVVVIGSGATAVTLVPAMAPEAEHVTMLQRSPSYVLAMPRHDPLARLLRRVLSPRRAYPVVRWKNTLVMTALFKLSRARPGLVKKFLRKEVQRRLPEGFDVDRHFRPRYDPWDQRMCFVPDGDLFRVLREGRASIVTDTIEAITEHGIRLTSGEELPADVIVTATGLNLLPAGGIRLTVDGEHVELADTVAYKGMMLSGVPNFALTIGYTNASWTLKADLVAQYVCRVLAHMREHDYDRCVPVAPAGDQPLEPLIDLKAGYVLRGVDSLPRQGPSAPWRLHQNYARDVLLLRRGRVDDEGVRFSRAGAGQPSGGGALR
ncbi:flavin-containing monooxygenase [Prauserella cavernicola]|uniref:NAD(P)/FAD-dependent oxidoreductase n=1 Tax=Prauserella cavernicola TaxID=2800127 RepID=A0A934V3Y4_9PSEU|nr:NAD(P)/FAD-dependent oxidoreductase [Prauserella cavernicola]MBK1782998.1 NAD(P)/FAD-dependent oxidoreductase [Prauserella cavernicola]